MELGFFPTKGRYDAAAVFRAATEAGADPWPLLAADGRALATFLKRRPTRSGPWPRVDRFAAVVRPPEGCRFAKERCARTSTARGTPLETGDPERQGS